MLDRRSPTSLIAGVLAVALWLGVSACGETRSPYEVALGVDPAPMTPGFAADINVILGVGGQPELGATVTGRVLVQSGGAAVALPAFEGLGDGTYTAAGLVVDEEGTHTLELTITGSQGVQVASYPLEVTCATSGELGAACCTADACGAGLACETGICTPAVEVLGRGTHDLAAVRLDAIAVASDGLSLPRDLAFEPGTHNLWVINRTTESTTILFEAGSQAQMSQNYWGFGTQHFMAQPAAIAFGQPGTMATIHETDQPTQGPVAFGGTPGDFMGPTLHSTDLAIYTGGEASHLDMLHNSPLGMGIAWEADNIYWVFDGYHSAITRYDFRIDHGPAGTDHTDGIIRRYVEGQVQRVADVPSHMEMDRASKLLYVADTGNNRVAVLDTNTGSVSSAMPLFDNYDGLVEMSHMGDAALTTLVDGAAVGLQQPSGLELMGDVVIVTDHATGFIHAFDKATGGHVDYLDTGLGAGALMGIAAKDGALYFVDAAGNRVMRLMPR